MVLLYQINRIMKDVDTSLIEDLLFEVIPEMKKDFFKIKQRGLLRM